MKGTLDLTTFLAILAFLLILSFLIAVHEMGHFLVGRALGFTILEYSLGMGPVVLKKNDKRGTQFSLRALPTGGMCRFYGEDQPVQDERCFNAKPVWKRMLVVLAGPVVNLIFAVLFAFCFYIGYGEICYGITEVNQDSPAAIAGIMPGDVITEIDGETVTADSDVVSLIRYGDIEKLNMTVLRDGTTLKLTVSDMYQADEGYNMIGITLAAAYQRVSFSRAVALSFFYVGDTVSQTCQAIGKLFSGKAQGNEFGSIIMVGTVTVEAIKNYGFDSVLQIIMLLSVSLGFINLLPIPALDGGRFLFMLIELIRGKPAKADVEGTIHFIGLILLLALMALLMYNDIANLVKGVF